MNRTISRWTLGAALVAGLVACSQDAEEHTGTDPARLSTLIQYIPVDTPYLAANLEPMPDPVLDKFWSALDPLMKLGQEQLASAIVSFEQREAQSSGQRVLVSILQEVDGKLSREGLTGLGLAIEYLAIYGDGALPVLRIGLSDRSALEAAIARVEASSGVSAAPLEVAGRTYYRFDDEGDDRSPVGLLGILDDHIVMGVALPGEEAQTLDRLLGVSLPDTHALSRIQATNLDYELLPFGTGILDPVSLVEEVMTLAGRVDGVASISPACQSDYRRLAGAIPEIVSGYSTLDTTLIEQRTVVGLDSDLIPAMQSIATPMHGLVPSDQGTVYAAAGLDIQKLRDFLIGRIVKLRENPLTCEQYASQMTNLDQVEAQLGQPLPPFVGNLRGFRLSLDDFELDATGNPVGGRGLIAVMMDNPQLIVGMGQAFLPEIAQMGLVPDGEPRAVPTSLLMSSGLKDVFAAMTTHGLAFSVGQGTETRLEAFLDAPQPPRDTSPLMTLSYDVKAVAELQRKGLDQASASAQWGVNDRELAAQLTAASERYYELFGRVQVTMAVTGRGLEISSSTTLN